MPPVELLVRALVALTLLAAGVAVLGVDRPRGRYRERLRSRFLLGVPWGTVAAGVLVVAVYGFLQHGFAHPRSPLVLPYVSWSYLYPFGVAVAPFAHNSLGHVTGNLLGLVVLGPLAEYAWGHFPTRRGETAFSSLRTNPYVRAFVLFPLGIVAVGLATTVFHWGPVVGFSGVVFALAGFALVRYPLGVVVALAAEELISVLYRALLDPVDEFQAGTSYVTPPWADVAIEAHVLGLVLGALLGVLVLSRRDDALPSGLRLLAGTAFVSASLSVWAVWWYEGASSYVLYRGLGVALLLSLSAAIVLAVRASDREFVAGVSRRTAATLLLVFPLLVMASVAVPVNLTTVADGPPGEEAVSARGYQVTYAEDVRHGKVPAVNVSVFGASTNVTTSGVIVVDPARELWTTEITESRLAAQGGAYVVVGGPDWRELVGVRRHGWSAVGGGTAYQVWLGPPGDDWRHVFASGNATADPVIRGRNVTVVAEDGSFSLAVSRGGDLLGRAALPSADDPTSAGDLTFRRDGQRVLAIVDDTRVTVATRERYD